MGYEAPHAERVLKGYETEFVMGDKAYDAEHVLLTITEMDAEAVIPPKRNRNEPRDYDKELYKERHCLGQSATSRGWPLVECFFNKLKHYRRCFARFDKLARNYLSFLHFASTLIWLR